MSKTPRPWPHTGLETVPHCLMCGSAELREMLQPVRRDFHTVAVRK